MGITTPGSEGPDLVTSRGRGTAQYLAPELRNGRTYNYHTDMWALGCVIYEFATGDAACSVYPSTESGDEEFPSKEFPFAGVEAEFIFCMIKDLLNMRPQNRPSSKALLDRINKHEFDDNEPCQSFAYSFHDNPWLRKVGKVVHHVEKLDVPSGASGSHLHVVNMPFGTKLIKCRSRSSRLDL